MNKKVLVTGASGLVGSRLVELLGDKFKLFTPREKELNILDQNAVNTFVKNNNIEVILNLTAYTNVDEAEKQKSDKDGLAWKLNVEAVKNLLTVCKEKDIFLVHFSTDFVFQGNENNPGPYSEDAILPESSEGISWYGWTKNRAEVEIKESGCRHSIIRIAYPFYPSNFDGKLDFAKGFINLFDNKKLYPVFSDQVLSVLNVDDLVDPLIKVISDEVDGTFHVVSSDTTSPFEFAEYLLEKTRDTKNILQKGSMVDFLNKEGRTPRPRLGGLKIINTEDKLGMKLKTWKEMVDSFVENSK